MKRTGITRIGHLFAGSNEEERKCFLGYFFRFVWDTCFGSFQVWNTLVSVTFLSLIVWSNNFSFLHLCFVLFNAGNKKHTQELKTHKNFSESIFVIFCKLKSIQVFEKNKKKKKERKRLDVKYQEKS